MERLTERTEEGFQCNDHKCRLSYCDRGCEHYQLMVDKLAEYEDAEEQGLLIRLPFAIGKPIYKVCFASEIGCGFVYEGTMTLKFYADNMKDFEAGIVYTSKEEAEQALASMKGV